MLDAVESIDLDALFDSLNIAIPRAAVVSGPSIKPVFSDFDGYNSELQQMSAADLDLCLFDNPTDQS